MPKANSLIESNILADTFHGCWSPFLIEAGKFAEHTVAMHKINNQRKHKLFLTVKSTIHTRVSLN